MTYNELSRLINGMTDEQKDCDVSVYLKETDEVLPCCDFVISWDKDGSEKVIDGVDGVLDFDHPFLVIDF